MLIANWSFGEYVTLAEWVLRVLALLIVPIRRTSASASAWLLLILLLPELGFPLYLVVGRARVPRRVRRRRAEFPGAHTQAFERLAAQGSRNAVPAESIGSACAGLAERLGHFRPLGGNAVESSADRHACVERLVADIDAALDHVHLLTYIWGSDEVSDEIGSALARAVGRGLACRVLVDATGTGRRGKRDLRRLRRKGVEIAFAFPFSLARMLVRRADLRNHRKIVVVDGRVAHMGSMNIDSPRLRDGTPCEDLNVRVVGPVVLQLQLVFLADWHIATGRTLDAAATLPPTEAVGDVVAQVLPSGPSFPDENFRRILVDLIHGARQRVVLVTPYLIPDESTLNAMTTAALRGVVVDVVIPERSDGLVIGFAVNSYVAPLLRDGVRIHRYPKAFLHAKHATIDENVVLVGSGNIDIRSFTLNEEIELLLFGRAAGASIRAEQARLLAASRLVCVEDWSGRSAVVELAERLARLFSPLL